MYRNTLTSINQKKRKKERRKWIRKENIFLKDNFKTASKIIYRRYKSEQWYNLYTNRLGAVFSNNLKKNRVQ